MPASRGFKDYRVEKSKVELLIFAILLILKIIMKPFGSPRAKTRHEDEKTGYLPDLELSYRLDC